MRYIEAAPGKCKPVSSVYSFKERFCQFALKEGEFMFFRSIRIMAVILCMASLSRSVLADGAEAGIREMEAKLIYEAASKLVEDEEYSKSLRRLNLLILEYPDTEYALLAESKKSEIAILKVQPGLISGVSRASLVGFGTLFTSWVGLGSWIISESEEPEVLGIIMIAAPLGGLAGSMMLTRNMHLSDGQASLINFGGYWGIWQATGAAIIANANDKATIGASMAGGIIGLAISGSIVQHRYITPGDATMINFGGIWGTWFALCGAMLADVEDSHDILTSSMVGGDVGLFALAVLSSKMEMSRTRARLINLGGVVGTLYGLGTSVLFEIDSNRDFWSLLGISGILGLTAGAYFTRNYDGEEGYFAEKTVGEAGFGWNRGIDSPAIMFPSIYSKQGRISGMDFRMPLVSLRF